METTGKVILVLPEVTGVSRSTGNAWASQSFVIETLGQFPRKQHFELFGSDRIAINLPQMGEEVTVSFDYESREYEGKWFNSARAYKVVKSNAATTAQQAAAQPLPPQAPAQPAPAASVAPAAQPTNLGDNTGLPF